MSSRIRKRNRTRTAAPRDLVLARKGIEDKSTGLRRPFFLHADGFIEDSEGIVLGNVALWKLQHEVETDGSIEHIVQDTIPDGLYSRLEDTSIRTIPIQSLLDEHKPMGTKSLYIVQAQKGMGKSKAVRKAIRNLHPETGVISLTFRRTLARGTAKDMGSNARSYLDYDATETFNPTNHPRLTILVNSLGRVSTDTSKNYDVLLIDEVVSVLGMLGSRIIEDGQRLRILEKLCELVSKATVIIAADAIIHKHALMFLRSLLFVAQTPWKTQVLDYVHRNHSDWTFLYARDEKHWFDAVSERLSKGKRGVFPCMTRSFAKKLRSFVEDNFPDLKILLYVADSAEHDMEDHMSRVNEVWKEWDVVIWSPVITAGCSFEETHFDFCALQSFQGTCDVFSAVQMTSRVRSLSDKEVIVFLQNVDEGFHGEINPQEELVNHEMWHRIYMNKAKCQDRSFQERVIWLQDIVMAASYELNAARIRRFEYSFWKVVAWMGPRLSALGEEEKQEEEERERTSKQHREWIDCMEKSTPRMYGSKKISGPTRQLLRRIREGIFPWDCSIQHINMDRQQAHAMIRTKIKGGKLSDLKSIGEEKEKGEEEKDFEMYFGTYICPDTGKFIQCPNELRLVNRIGMYKRGQTFALGGPTGRDVQLKIRHFEELGLIMPMYKNVSPQHLLSHSFKSEMWPVLPDWMSVELEVPWQLAVEHLALRMAMKHSCTSIIPPPKYHTPSGITRSITFSKKDLNPEDQWMYHHMSEDVYKSCPIPPEPIRKLWSKYFPIKVPYIASTTAWNCAALIMGLESLPSLDEQQTNDMFKYAMQASNMLNTHIFSNYERIYLIPFLGKEAFKRGVHCTFMAQDAEKEIHVRRVNFVLRKPSMPELYRMLPGSLTGSAAVNAFYKLPIATTGTLCINNGMSVEMSFSDRTPLESESIVDHILTPLFVETPPLRIASLIPNDPMGNSWTVWWPCGSVSDTNMKREDLLELMDHLVSRNHRMVTWNGTTALIESLKDRSKHRLNTTDTIIHDQDLLCSLDDVAWHCSFISGEMKEYAKDYILQINHKMGLNELIHSFEQASKQFRFLQARPIMLRDQVISDQLTMHAAGTDPFETTEIDHGKELRAMFSKNPVWKCVHLCTLYTGCYKSGYIIIPYKETWIDIQTDPFLRVGDILGWTHVSRLLQ